MLFNVLGRHVIVIFHLRFLSRFSFVMMSSSRQSARRYLLSWTTSIGSQPAIHVPHVVDWRLRESNLIPIGYFIETLFGGLTLPTAGYMRHSEISRTEKISTSSTPIVASRADIHETSRIAENCRCHPSLLPHIQHILPPSFPSLSSSSLLHLGTKSKKTW